VVVPYLHFCRITGRSQSTNLGISISGSHDDLLRVFAGHVEGGVLCRIDGVKWAGENLTEIAGVWLPEIMSLPDSLPWIESVDAKMVRAKEHLDTLHAEAGVFFESTKRNFILKSNGQEAWIVHYIEGSILGAFSANLWRRLMNETSSDCVTLCGGLFPTS